MTLTRRKFLGAATAAACAVVAVTPVSALAAKPLTIGFSQVGAESEWRTANTASIKDAAKRAGVTLKFADAQQQQQNQVKALRSFIAQRVDVIAFSPVVETGWETVLREAKNAKIPVILTDRSVKVSDPSLYVSFIGSDFVEEGRRAGRWLMDYARKHGDKPLNIVELQGTTGAAPAIDRKTGFQEIIGANPKLKIIRSQTGDFTRAKGKEVMERGSGPETRHRHRHRLDRRRARRVRGHEGRQAERDGRVQSAARPPADPDRAGCRGRQAGTEAHRGH
jgi:ABC-type sugar transport system substrate-binding protein